MQDDYSKLPAILERRALVAVARSNAIATKTRLLNKERRGAGQPGEPLAREKGCPGIGGDREIGAREECCWPRDNHVIKASVDIPVGPGVAA